MGKINECEAKRKIKDIPKHCSNCELRFTCKLFKDYLRISNSLRRYNNE